MWTTRAKRCAVMLSPRTAALYPAARRSDPRRLGTSRQTAPTATRTPPRATAQALAVGDPVRPSQLGGTTVPPVPIWIDAEALG